MYKTTMPEGEAVVLDLETTGYDPRWCRIIQVGAVRLDLEGEGVIEQINLACDPGIPIPWEMTEKHGVQYEDLQGMPIFRDIAPHVVEFLGDSPFIGYNVQFDYRFLDYELQKNGFDGVDNQTHCVMWALKRIWGRKTTLGEAVRRLTPLSDELQALEFNAHDALSDALATAYIARLLTREPKLVEAAGEQSHACSVGS